MKEARRGDDLIGSAGTGQLALMRVVTRGDASRRRFRVVQIGVSALVCGHEASRNVFCPFGIHVEGRSVMEHRPLSEQELSELNQWVHSGDGLSRPAGPDAPEVVRKISELLEMWESPEPPEDLVERTLVRTWTRRGDGSDSVSGFVYLSKGNP